MALADTDLASLVLSMLDETDRAAREQLEVLVRARAKQTLKRGASGGG